MDFTTIQKDIANEIVNIGLSKAADSMAFFTKEKVLIKGHHVQKLSFDEMDNISSCSKNDLLYVLTTEIKGELTGICYLIFSEDEVEKLLQVSLPESILNDPEKLRVMGDAILLEMDNIIVASVITQFSNFFKFSMYGDVPRLTKVPCEDLKAMVMEENQGQSEFMYFKSTMQTEGLEVAPDFVWLLDDKFYQGVVSVSANDAVLKKLDIS